jgi:hypothetical protein
LHEFKIIIMELIAQDEHGKKASEGGKDRRTTGQIDRQTDMQTGRQADRHNIV